MAVTANNGQTGNVRPDGTVSDRISEFNKPYKELMSYYRCAMRKIETKFIMMSEELSLKYDRNPIETIKTRIKTPESILEKLNRRKLPVSFASIEENLFDIAGVRVICSFPSDIYQLADALSKQDDVTVVERKDYIDEPKGNGYRSLHLIVQTPIFLLDRKKMMKVEVQFRTISMDWWASLEHQIRYKKDLPSMEFIENELQECARTAAELDVRMERLQKLAEQIKQRESAGRKQRERG